MSVKVGDFVKDRAYGMRGRVIEREQIEVKPLRRLMLEKRLGKVGAPIPALKEEEKHYRTRVRIESQDGPSKGKSMWIDERRLEVLTAKEGDSTAENAKSAEKTVPAAPAKERDSITENAKNTEKTQPGPPALAGTGGGK